MGPRDFPNNKNGYYNAALGVAGTAIPFPPGCSSVVLTVSAPVWLGLRPSNVLLAFNDDNYGAFSGGPLTLTRGNEAYLHLAAATGTVIVAAFFG